MSVDPPGGISPNRGLAHEAGFAGGFDGMLLDLGVSSPQLDDPRAASASARRPAGHAHGPRRGQSAAEWLAAAPEREIARVLRDYGEERHAPSASRARI
jgi:16S rRNA (cytosine1402-N4)-methyltransferase